MPKLLEDAHKFWDAGGCADLDLEGIYRYHCLGDDRVASHDALWYADKPHQVLRRILYRLVLAEERNND